MTPIEDHAYLKLCAKLAACKSISLASARRQVELAAMRDGVRDLDGRKALAEGLIANINSSAEEGTVSSSARFDELLEAMADEENFMVED